MHHTESQIHQLQKVGLVWLVAYLAFMAFATWLVFHLRDQYLESLDTPAARAEWESWREAAGQQSISGPVKRRVPESHEPPTLVLLRDHFGVVLGATLVFGSVLFGTLMFMIRGALRTTAQTPDGSEGRARK